MKTQELICKKYFHENGKLWEQAFYLNGNLHNEDGPAFCRWSKNGELEWEEYWIKGEPLTKDLWQERIDKLKEGESNMIEKSKSLEDQVDDILYTAEIDCAGTLQDRLKLLGIKYRIALLEVERLKLELEQYE